MIPSYRCSDLPLVGEPLYPCSRSVHAYVPYGTGAAGYSWEYYAVCGIPRMHPWFSLFFFSFLSIVLTFTPLSVNLTGGHNGSY
ncbi:hypothetical protein BDV38DRAFT_254842, partial [Aspergillus pseudotamarii]